MTKLYIGSNNKTKKLELSKIRKIAIEKLKARKLPKWEEDVIMKTLKSPTFGWM